MVGQGSLQYIFLSLFKLSQLGSYLFPWGSVPLSDNFSWQENSPDVQSEFLLSQWQYSSTLSVCKKRNFVAAAVYPSQICNNSYASDSLLSGQGLKLWTP